MNQNNICDSNEIFGCTYNNATNFNQFAVFEDGSCLFENCDETEIYNDGFQDGVDSVDCGDDCPGDYTGDGSVTIADLLQFLILFGNICD